MIDCYINSHDWYYDSHSPIFAYRESSDSEDEIAKIDKQLEKLKEEETAAQRRLVRRVELRGRGGDWQVVRMKLSNWNESEKMPLYNQNGIFKNKIT